MNGVISNLTDLVGDIIAASEVNLQVLEYNDDGIAAHRGRLEKSSIAFSPDDEVFLTITDNGRWINERHLIIKHVDTEADAQKTAYHIADDTGLLMQIELCMGN